MWLAAGEALLAVTAAPNSPPPVANAAPKDSPVDGAMPKEGAGADARKNDDADGAGRAPNPTNPTVADLATAPAR